MSEERAGPERDRAAEVNVRKMIVACERDPQLQEELLRDPKTNQETVKPVLLLDEDRALPCNKTNLQMLVSLFNSDDSDDWTGEQIEIYVDMTVSFGGQQKGGLRLRKPSDSNFPPPDEDQDVPPAPEPAAVAVTVTSRRSRSRG